MAKSVLFVCFGNICRSTMAEAVFLNFLKQRGEQGEWKVDSAGHGNWHLGKQPEPRTLQVLAHHGIHGYSHTARLITKEDFFNYNYILGMDDYNLRNLKAMKPPDSECYIGILGAFDPQGVLTIFDPYFSDSIEAYEEVYQQCHRCCKVFLNYVTKSKDSKPS